MKTRGELYQKYEEELARIDKQARDEKEKARAKLKEQLEILRTQYHQELKAIRAISQKVRGGD